MAMRQKRTVTSAYNWNGTDLDYGQIGINYSTADGGTMHLRLANDTYATFNSGALGSTDLAGLSDVTVTSSGANELLFTTGANTWVNYTLTEAGIVSTTDTDVSSYSWVLDEDDFTSNSNTKVPTQQSVKAYVDAAVEGFNLKASVRVATAAALPAYTQAGAGTGATLTMDATGVVTIDGQDITAANSFAVGDRILVQGDGSASAADEGIYEVTTLSAVGVAMVLTRTTDADTQTELQSAYVFVDLGTTYADTSWLQTAEVTTVDTTAQDWTQFISAAEHTIANVGSGADVWRDRVGNVDNLRGLNSTSGDLTIAVNGDNIDFTVNSANDPDAIHDNVAGEISLIAYKGSPVGSDILLIEDGADSNNKKHTAISDLPITAGQITGAPWLENVVEDLTPELGGELDTGGNAIVTSGADHLKLAATGTGVILVGSTGAPSATTKFLERLGTVSAATGNRSLLIQDNLTLTWDDDSSGTNRNRSRVSTLTQDVNGFSSASSSRFHGSIGHMMSSYITNTGTAGPAIDWHMGLMGDAEVYNDVDIVNNSSVVGYFYNGGTGTVTNQIAFEAVFDSTATNNWVLKSTEATADIEIAGQVITGALTYPNTDSTAGFLLKTDGAGNIGFITPAGIDTSALHVDVANEITAITAKTTRVDADEMILEDSEAGFVKKSITIADLLDDGQF